MRYPGEVWFLPPDAREDGDKKGRRHVLLTSCAEADDCAVFAYASRQGREAAFGAAYVLLDPYATEYGKAGRTGFTHASYIYPCRLVGASSAELQRMVGRIIDELTALRGALHAAVGLKTGSSSGTGLAVGSWRGKIVRLSDDLAEEMDCTLCVIVTEPKYSNRQRYQIVVPLLDARDFDAVSSDLLVAPADWLRALDLPDGAILAVSLVQTAFHPLEIAEWTGEVVDEHTMSEVDSCLLMLFGL